MPLLSQTPLPPCIPSVPSPAASWARCLQHPAPPPAALTPLPSPAPSHPAAAQRGEKGPKIPILGLGMGVPKWLAQALGGMPAAHRQGTASLPRGRGRGRFHRSPGSWGCGTWQALGGKGTGLRPRANCTLVFFSPHQAHGVSQVPAPNPPVVPGETTDLRHRSCLGTGHRASR